jgi:uncharacterized membrane protein
MNGLSRASPMSSMHLRALLLAIAVVVIGLAAIVPPVQAPDEPSHVSRAYMLAHGRPVLDALPDGRSGGNVDRGLLEFMAVWSPLVRQPSVRATPDMEARAALVAWSGETSFRSFRATSLYSPLPYLPAAVALGIGETTGLSVVRSYQLANAAVITCSLVTLWCAFRVLRPNPAVIAVIVLPMSMFQIASPVIDGLCMCLTTLVMAVFVRVVRDGDRAPRGLVPLMALAAVVVVTARPQVLPIVMLVPLCGLYGHRRISIWTGACALAVTAAWMTFALLTNHSVRPDVPSLGTAEVVRGYISDPASLVRVVAATLDSPGWAAAQFRSFVGVLGALDTPLRPEVYPVLAGLAVTCVIASVRLSAPRTARLAAFALLAVAVISATLVLLTLLMLFTPHPTLTIRGIQGRYFLIPALVAAYATTCSWSEAPRWRRWVGGFAMWGLICISAAAAVSAAASRYYGSP